MPRKKALTKEQKKEAVANGLTEALLGQSFGNFSALGNNPYGSGTPLNQTSTLWKNNRWYLLSNFWQLLSESYIEHGLIQTVVDVPVDDAFRGGFEIKTKQLEPEQIERLNALMEEYNDINILGQAHKWNRLYGGAGVIVVTDQNSATPLDVDSIHEGDKLAFHAVDMWELFGSKLNITQPNVPYNTSTQDEYYNYYGMKLHSSRVMKLVGVEAPAFIRPRLRGWGVSVVEVMVNSINQYLKNNNLVFEVLDEFKIDVYKLKDLAATLLQPCGDQAVQRRVAVANLQKNFQHAVVLDSQDDFVQKQLAFTGLAETMTGIRMQVASDLRMPLSKVFGIAAQGFSSGEDDLENYNGMVESGIRAKSRMYAVKMVKLRCAQEFGFIPDDLTINFKPLRVLTAEQEENVKSQQFARTLQATQAGLMTAQEFKEACNKAELLPIQVDPSVERIDLGGDDSEEVESSVAVSGAGQKSKLKPKDAKA